jgi:hypothetical protein
MLQGVVRSLKTKLSGEYHGQSQDSGLDYGSCTDPNVHDFHLGYAYYNHHKPWHLARNMFDLLPL